MTANVKCANCKDFDDLRKFCLNLEDENKNLKTTVDELNKKIEELKEYNQSYKDENKELNGDRKKWKLEKSNLEDRIEELNVQIEQLKTSMNKLSDEYEDAKDDIDNIEGMKENLEMYKQNVNKLNKELFAKNQDYLLLRRNYEEQVNLNGIKEKRISELTARISEAESKLIASANDIESLKSQLKTKSIELMSLGQMDENYKQLQIELQNTKKELERYRGYVDSSGMSFKIDAIQKKYDDSTRAHELQISQLNQQLSDKQLEIDTMNQQIELLKDIEAEYNKCKSSTACVQCKDLNTKLSDRQLEIDTMNQQIKLLQDIEVEYNKLKLQTGCAECNDNLSKHNKLIKCKDNEIYWYRAVIMSLLLGMFIYYLVNNNDANPLNNNIVTAGFKNESIIDSTIKVDDVALNVNSEVLTTDVKNESIIDSTIKVDDMALNVNREVLTTDVKNEFIIDNTIKTDDVVLVN